MVAHRSQLHRGSRLHERRRCRAAGAVRVRDPRGAAARTSPTAVRCSWSARAPSASSRFSRREAPHPRGPRDRGCQALRSNAWRPVWRARTSWWFRNTRSRPCVAPSTPMKLTPERGMDFLLGGVDVAIECDRLQERARPRAPHHQGRRAGRVERHPRPGRRPHAGLVPRARARRCVHRRHRASRRRRPFDVRHGDRAGERPADARRHGRARRTRSLAGVRRSITRWAPAGSARSKVAFAPQET